MFKALIFRWSVNSLFWQCASFCNSKLFHFAFFFFFCNPPPPLRPWARISQDQFYFRSWEMFQYWTLRCLHYLLLIQKFNFVYHPHSLFRDFFLFFSLSLQKFFCYQMKVWLCLILGTKNRFTTFIHK